MPSNKELVASATELAAALGIEIDTDGMNNKDLSALVVDLRAKHTDAQTHTQADAAPAPEVAAPAPEVAADTYVIAGGRAITSRKGILSGDAPDEVKPEYLAGGQKAFDKFVKSGHIVKA